MNCDTGRIIEAVELSAVPPHEREKYVEMVVPPTPIQRGRMKVSRNDRCPCGSGKKFKHCHWSGR